jgi:predicted acetyltransferase
LTVRPLGVDDLQAVSRLNQLSFGYTSDRPLTDPTGMHGIHGSDGALVAAAHIRSYEQLWGGRRVPMGGICGVVVDPHARRHGIATTLLRGLLSVLRAAGQPISVLYPTGVGVYRPVGWEVVGSLEDTRIPTADLVPRRAGTGVAVRAAVAADLDAIAGIYAGLGSSGLLMRDGVEFPGGARAVLDHDVATVAVTDDGTPVGFSSYARGSGYRASELRIWNCHATTAPAMAALLQSLSSWSTVAPTVLWRGPTDELALHLSRAVPPPVDRQPWMLRVVDAPAAIAARGFAQGVSVEASFALADPHVPEHVGPWTLRVGGGVGTLQRCKAGSLPQLSIAGLALLYAGAADTGALVRTGHLDREVAGLDEAFAGQPPRICDYF